MQQQPTAQSQPSATAQAQQDGTATTPGTSGSRPPSAVLNPGDPSTAGQPQQPPPTTSSSNAASSALNADDFELGRLIGFGSSATVHLSAHRPSNQPCAIKLIDLDQFERNQIDELRRELQVMSLCKHANLLSVRVRGYSYVIVIY